ncbi:ArsR family transcriptional regulator [Halorarum halophilum]|uniref:ArsR family transcriptional regulator n=1 Tax=Halorarum halophilum TaxID=2743090 RepID=A0A7D5L2J6_9EURY|nr:ArsR family transcriptional regulator [Halobaculum halophilum]QLG26243.1 ArsR family transcriptional regulator [Halobaculum halophilum]
MDRDNTSPDPTGEDGSTDTSTAAVFPPADELYRALGTANRRRVLYYLLDRQAASMEELSDFLSGWKAATAAGPVGPEERRRTRTRLYHTDVPVLQDMGLVTVEEGSDGIRLVTVADPVRETIRSAIEYEEARGSVPTR